MTISRFSLRNWRGLLHDGAGAPLWRFATRSDAKAEADLPTCRARRRVHRSLKDQRRLEKAQAGRSAVLGVYGLTGGTCFQATSRAGRIPRNSAFMASIETRLAVTACYWSFRVQQWA